MTANWCAACGAYVAHNPHDLHHILLDMPSNHSVTSAPPVQIPPLLRRIHMALVQNRSSAHTIIVRRP